MVTTRRTDILRVGVAGLRAVLCLGLCLSGLACKQGQQLARNNDGGSLTDTHPDGLVTTTDGPCGSPTDPKNCGTCGNDCSALPNLRPGAAVECRNGSCFLPITACAAGFGHCSMRSDEFCETSLTTSENCGACGTKCTGAAPLCATGAAGIACTATCAAPMADKCGSSCVDLKTDPRNCGSCGFNCAELPNVKPGAAVTCAAGECVVPPSSCAAGFAHCPGNAASLGCETSLTAPATCGSCTTRCTAPTANCAPSATGGAPTCSSSCVAPTPNLCNLSCVNLQTDAANCGSCGFSCASLPNVRAGAPVSCVAGQCVIPATSCVSGFAHCSSTSAGSLGCETSLTSPNTCGSCTTKCAAPTANCAPSATGGVPTCSSSCAAPTPDLCDQSCVNFQSDAANCGRCGFSCTSLPNVRSGAPVSCVAGQCVIPPSSCVAGFAHCAGSAASLGCETSLMAPATCGSCTNRCAAPTANCAMPAAGGTPTCTSSCAAPTPDLCTQSCVNFQTDPANCGSCGFSCAGLPNIRNGAPVSCVAGQCVIPPSSCLAGFAHCPGSAASLGCETNLSLPATCGSCTNRCVAPTASCSTPAGGGTPTCSSSCVAPTPNLCNQSCANFQTGAANCGSCGFSCAALPHVRAGAPVSCVAGLCVIPASSCEAGFAHCAGAASLGCETSLTLATSCGSCTNRCVAPTANCSMPVAGGTPACSSSCVAPNPNLCGQSCTNFQTDPANCGSCGFSCTSLPNVRSGAPVSCVAGQCVIPTSSCVAGFAHCAGSAASLGCETSLIAPATCGSCTNRCTAPTANCAMPAAGGTPACASSCVAPTPNLCTQSCVNFQTDPANCGSCGFSCAALPHVRAGASVSCLAGLCVIPASSCEAGFAHCTGAASLGCETSLTLPTSCGSCTNRCVSPTANCSMPAAGGTPACSSSCVAPNPNLCGQSCTNFQTDPANCGSCGFSCAALPHVRAGASVSCVAGLCVIPPSSCDAGFAHCTGATNLGCETSLTAPATCGSCTNRCVAPTANCTTPAGGGAAMCSSSCVAPTPNLCGQSCTNLQTDPANCGSCGFNCATLPHVRAGAPVSCVAGACVIPPSSCEATFAHCAGASSLGCETSLTAPATCGSCTNRCVAPTANCTTPAGGGAAMCSSSCVAPTPNLCGQSCANLQTDPANCGSCGHNCAALPRVRVGAPVSCVAGACVIPPSSCESGFAHCAGAADLGCETPTNTGTNCGGCNIPCTNATGATASCATGQCVQMCNGGMGDCTTAPGCETPLNTAQHCGACTTVCGGATPDCNATTRTCTCASPRAQVCGGTQCCSPVAAGSNTTISCTPPAGQQCVLQCLPGTHSCTGTVSSCVSDIEASMCAAGSVCIDCRQPNASATCGTNTCANSCNLGSSRTLSCPAVGGKPNCSSWTFESGGMIPSSPTEGWVLGGPEIIATASDARTGSFAISSAQKNGGSFSLAIGFNGNGSAGGRTSIAFKTKLCTQGTALDLSAKTLQAKLRFVPPPPASGFMNIFVMLFTDSGLTSYGGAMDFSIDTATGGGTDPNTGASLLWYPFELDGVSVNGPVTGIGFNVFVGDPYVGTIFLDDVDIF